MTFDILDKYFTERGFSFQVEKRNDKYSLSIFKEKWVTDNPHKAVRIPTGTGDSLLSAYQNLMEKISNELA